MRDGPAVGYIARTMSKPKHKPPQTTGQLQAMAKRTAKRHGLRRELARLLSLLTTYANHADLDDDDGLIVVWPSNDALAARLSVTARSVARRLARLEALGLVRRPTAPTGGHHGKRYGRRDGGGGLAFANGLILDLNAWRRPPVHMTLLPDTSTPKCQVEVSCRKAKSVMCNPSEVSGRSVMCIEPNEQPDTEPNIEPPLRGAREGPVEGLPRVDVEALPPNDQADLFITCYPKTAGSAYLARLAFLKVIGRGVEARAVLRAAWHLGQAVKANPEQARYIPYPHNWLESQGWVEVQALIDRITPDATRYDPAEPRGANQIAG